VNGNHTAEQYQKDLANFTAIFDERLSRPSIVPLAKTPGVSRRLLKPIRYWAGAAAAATIFLALVAIWVQRPANTSASQARIAAYTSASQAGERRPFLLPDGSRVLLNASSHVTVLAGFGDTSREVSLTGEAYFDVAKDVNRPFVIHTATIDVRVLGTAFNVKAYPGDKLTETSLIKGSIEVLVKGGVNRKIILRPSEKISIPTQAAAIDGKAMRIAGQKQPLFTVEKLVLSPADSLPVEISWTASCLAFNDNSLEEIAPQLERWYNVNIRFEDQQVKEYRYTATFDKKTVAQVLTALALSRPFDYRWVDEKTIIIKSRKMKNQ
jgi:ferric-dicitrate binding protein FerR (iron transport regulator)